MKVTVIGSSHSAHALAAWIAKTGSEVFLCDQGQFSDRVAHLAQAGEIRASGALGSFTARINATTDFASAFGDADLIVFATPAVFHEDWLRRIADCVNREKTPLVLLGFAHFFGYRAQAAVRKMMGDRAVTVVETSNCPLPARAFELGVVEIVATRKLLLMSAAGADGSRNATWTLQWLRDCCPDIRAIEGSLAASFNNTTPILHAPLTLLNATRIESRAPSWNLFGDGATEFACGMMMKCDDERTEVANAYRIAVTPIVEAFSKQFSSPIGSGRDLSKFLRNSPIHANPSHKPPSNFRTRYLTEDVPFSIAPWARLGRRAGVKTPALETLVTLYDELARAHGVQPTSDVILPVIDNIPAPGIAMASP